MKRLWKTEPLLNPQTLEYSWIDVDGNNLGFVTAEPRLHESPGYHRLSKARLFLPLTKMHVVKYQLSQAEDVDEDSTNEHGLRLAELREPSGYLT